MAKIVRGRGEKFSLFGVHRGSGRIQAAIGRSKKDLGAILNLLMSILVTQWSRFGSGISPKARTKSLVRGGPLGMKFLTFWCPREDPGGFRQLLGGPKKHLGVILALLMNILATHGSKFGSGILPKLTCKGSLEQKH